MKRVLFFCIFILFTVPAFSQTLINVALSGAGATASASSAYNTAGVQFPAANAIQGHPTDANRGNWCGVGQSCNPNNGWAAAASSSAPQWLEVDFPVSRTLSEIDTFEVQDSPTSPGTQPTLSTTCSTYCNSDFEVQYCSSNCAGTPVWTDIPSGHVTSNTHVWNKFTISPAITTTKIRYYINTSPGGLFGLVDIEAYYLHPAGHQTTTAASCGENDVIAVVGVTLDGDTVNIPSGTCTWSGVGAPVPAGIGITVMGAGTPTADPTKFAPDSSCSGGSNTTINIAAGIFVGATPTYGASTMRVSCVKLNETGNALAIRIDGTCTASGCPSLRIDNVYFTNWQGFTHPGNSYGINWISEMFGVFDHDQVDGVAENFLALAEFNHAHWLGVGDYGDNSWHVSEGYGSASFLFFENDTLNYASCCENEGGTGSSGTTNNGGGGRAVVRFSKCSIDNSNSCIMWHEQRGRAHGGRAYEFYQTTVDCSIANATACSGETSVRSGTGLNWGNSMFVGASVNLAQVINFANFRVYGDLATPASANWGVCDGSSVYDVNDGTTYFDGKAGTISGNVLPLTDSMGASQSWSAHLWQAIGANTGKPYSLHDVTLNTGGEITDSGTSSVTLNLAGAYVGWSPANGDHIQILRASACTDQGAGRGAGTLYTGTTNDSNLNPLPASSSAQALSPVYSWMHTITGNTTCTGTCGVFTGSNHMIANRDWYEESEGQAAQSNPTTPFNGTTGIGHGVRSNRPTTCTTGVMYWSVDQGSWNSTTQGGITVGGNTYYNGVLDQCTATNTWTNAFYTPYTYPHPLDASSAPATTNPSGGVLLLGIGQ